MEQSLYKAYTARVRANVRRMTGQASQEARLSEEQQARLCVQLRRQAAVLLEAVFDETLSPQMVMNRWPDHPLVEDPSLQAALQALWYFEADEELHRTELFYLDIQLELLRQIWRHLKEGRALPKHLLQSYAPDLAVRYHYPSQNPWQVLWRDTQTAWQRFARLFRQSISALPGRK